MTLSVCLIVKNEEPVLARCLSCAVQIADELIVVDTGSTDHSVEIAKQFTPKVYLHPWQDSFAEARNYAYSKATCDYMMWLDADDVISDENIARFLKLKRTMPEDTDVVFTLYRTPVEDGIGTYILRDRIIRRSLDPKCKGDAHEAIPIQSAWKRLYATDITIFHKKEYVNDPNRNMNIFKKVLREQPDMNAFDKANYCKELFIAGEHEKAYEVFQEYKRYCTAVEYYYGFFFVVRSLLSLKRYETCIRELEELERSIPTTAYMVYWQGFCHEALGEKEKAEQTYLSAMTIPEDPTTLYIQHTGYTDYFPLLGLARIEAKRRNKEKAREYIEKAAELYPLHPEWKKEKIELMFLL